MMPAFNRTTFVLIFLLFTTTNCNLNENYLVVYVEPENSFHSVRSLAASANTSTSSAICAGVDLGDLLSRNFSLSDLKNSTNDDIDNNALMQVMEGRKSYPYYIRGLLIYIIPWAVLIIITIIIYIGFVANCLCFKCGLRPKYTPIQKRVCILPMLVFGILLVICSIVAAGTAIEINKNIQKVVCVGSIAFDDFIYGSTSSGRNWVGILPLEKDLKDIADAVRQSPDTIQETFNNTAWMSEATKNQTTFLTQIYTNYSDETLANPDPSNSTAVLANLTRKQNLGPISSQKTLTGILSTEVNTTMDISSQLVEGLRNVTAEISDDADAIADKIDDTHTELQNYSNTLIKYQSDMDSTSGDVSSVGSHINTYSLIFSIVIAVIVLIAIVVSILVSVFNFAKMRIMLHCFWCVSMLATVICLAIGMIITPTSVAVSEACDIMHEVLYNSSALISLGKKLNISDLEQVDVCINGDGSIAGYYNISDQLSLLDELDNKTQQLKAYKENISLEEVNATSIVAGAVELTLNYTLPADADLKSLLVLAEFNSWSSSVANNSKQESVANCAKSQDVWVFNIASCPNDTNTKIFDPTGAADQNLPDGKTCLVPYQISKEVLQNRYNNSTFAGCNSAAVVNETSGKYLTIESLLVDYHSHLYDFQSQVDDLFTKLDNDLITYENNKQNFTAGLNGLYDSFDNFTTNVNNITNLLVGPTGLISRINCNFIGLHARRAYYATCEGVAPSVSKLGWVIPVFGLFLLIFTFFTFCLAVRNSRPTLGKGESLDDNFGSAPAGVELSKV